MKAKTVSKYKQMPSPDARRGGCKVSWVYYKDEAVAREAAKIAEHNGKVAWDEGYDFGYQSPGSLRKMPDDLKDNVHGKWSQFSGMWEVCQP